MNWPKTNIQDIIQAVEDFNPNDYAQTRNFKDGKVSMLSPYISRGIISTKYIFEKLKTKYPKQTIEKFVQELLWRDYFQRLLQSRPDIYNSPIRYDKFDVTIAGMPISVMNGATGINEIDNAIRDLYQVGCMHNHFRLYVSSVCCNMAKSRFNIPASWMYYHLLDADIASNFASWQWVSGHLTGKKYFANQENINFYSKSDQRNTFLDRNYDELQSAVIPEVLKDFTNPTFETFLPETEIPKLELKSALLYNFYNLDPFWHTDEEYERILILEPSHFDKFPISEKGMAFMFQLSENIPNLTIYCGEFEQLKKYYPNVKFIAKEHPLLRYEGAYIEERDWIVPDVKGYFSSFSKYYYQCLKNLKYD